MGYRVVSIYGVAFVAWVYVCFIELWINGFNFLLGCLGGVVGLVCGFVQTQWQLKVIEKNGEFKATRKRLAVALLAIIVLVLLLAYFSLVNFALYLAVARQMASFVFLILPLFYATQIGLFLNWERKQKKHIFSEGLMSTRIYTSPETEKRSV
jgi:uncharacterized membrane protein YqjE